MTKTAHRTKPRRRPASTLVASIPCTTSRPACVLVVPGSVVLERLA